jgi:dienelactone hydrolase
LRYYEELSVDELAKVLKMREKSARNLLSDATQKLRSRIAAQGFAVGGSAVVVFLEKIGPISAALKAPPALLERVSAALINPQNALLAQSGASVKAASWGWTVKIASILLCCVVGVGVF